MIRKSKSPVHMQLTRSGGSIILARVDVWRANDEDWEAVAQFDFSTATEKTEEIAHAVPKGSYTCVFQCFVEESLNGKYDFKFSVDDEETYADNGDVNTTSAPDDSKVYKDQFILEVK